MPDKKADEVKSKKPKLTLKKARDDALRKINKKRPEHYYSISPDRGRNDCLLWGYHKKRKYFEVVGRRHKSLPEFTDSHDLLATGRIYKGRGSVLFNKEDIRLQRTVAEELWSRYPLIQWWVFTEYDRGPVCTLNKHMGEDK